MELREAHRIPDNPPSDHLQGFGILTFNFIRMNDFYPNERFAGYALFTIARNWLLMPFRARLEVGYEQKFKPGAGPELKSPGLPGLRAF
ncbi:MAG: hypothetical protein APU95_02940 [Hadesarchaea archaeon YNP_N21]|nr:MAG: hypothetical protein APU95_02940 [Hadesarchaea archaeon YNP_N21]